MRDVSVGEGGTYAQILAALMYLFGLKSILLTLRSRQGMMLGLCTCKRWTFITLTRELMSTL